MNSEVLQSLRAVSTHVGSLAELFAADPTREWLVLDACGIHADFSRQHVNRQLFEQMLSAAESVDIASRFTAMSSGAIVNATELRAVGHLALRGSSTDAAMPQLAQLQLQRAYKLANDIRGGVHRGSTGELITDIVNIGIGGSDLGPVMAHAAMRRYTDGPRIHFVSNIDAAHLDDCLSMLAPSTTLFVIASKTFTTLETMSNAQRARLWLENAGMESAPHLVAVTAAPGVAVQWGVPAEQCLHFFDWVGGRFSLSSVIGFSVLCAMGERSFAALLEGMHEMDTHVLNAPLGQNLAVVHGLMWWLNSAVLQRTSIAVVPYSHDLRFLPAFLQQLMMESNGKSVHVDGSPVEAPTSPVVWGATGTDSQHAFFQMLHQGPQVIPVEFVGVVASTGSDDNAHLQLNANLFAQAQALAAGKLDAQGHKNFAGNRPSTVLMLDELSPRQLGALIAMYEHSCAVQGWLMGINSFDQWGVELGKVLAHDVAAELETGTLSTDKTMTHPLLEWYLRARKKLLPK